MKIKFQYLIWIISLISLLVLSCKKEKIDVPIDDKVIKKPTSDTIINKNKDSIPTDTFKVIYTQSSGWTNWLYVATISSKSIMNIYEEHMKDSIPRNINYILSSTETTRLKNILKELIKTDVNDEYINPLSYWSDMPGYSLKYNYNNVIDSTYNRQYTDPLPAYLDSLSYFVGEIITKYDKH